MLERRFFTSRVELRALTGPSSPGQITGYAAVFHQLSNNLGGFREKILPGAFSRCIRAGSDCVCTTNHDANLVLGRRKNKTLDLAEDSIGLRFRCLLPDTSYARDLVHSISRGDLDQCSFGFTATDPDAESWGEEPDPDDSTRSIRVRTLKNVRLFDVSVVTDPAYPNTSVSADTDAAPLWNSARSFRDYFPEGASAELRSRAGFDMEESFNRNREQRAKGEREAQARLQELTRQILSM